MKKSKGIMNRNLGGGQDGERVEERYPVGLQWWADCNLYLSSAVGSWMSVFYILPDDYSFVCI